MLNDLEVDNVTYFNFFMTSVAQQDRRISDIVDQCFLENADKQCIKCFTSLQKNR